MNRSRLSGQEIRLLYEGGATCQRIADLAGVTETAIRRRLHRMGVVFRNRQDYPATMGAAHAARRGAVDPLARRAARARTRELLMLGTSDLEDILARALDVLAIDYTRQKAIGPYNVDFAIGQLVIELSGGGHNPRVRRNWPARLAFLEGQGYRVLALRPAREPHWLALALKAATDPAHP